MLAPFDWQQPNSMRYATLGRVFSGSTYRNRRDMAPTLQIFWYFHWSARIIWPWMAKFCMLTYLGVGSFSGHSHPWPKCQSPRSQLFWVPFCTHGFYTSIFCVFYYVFNCSLYCVSWNCFACTFVTQLIKINQSINQINHMVWYRAT